VMAGAAAAQNAPDSSTETQPPARQQRRSRNLIDRWNQMSPAERERELAKLPPERAAAIRERIRKYNEMPHADKEALREGYDIFAQLPAEKQELVRQSLREFRRLPQDRQDEVHRAFMELRVLPEAQRTARLNSEEFHGKFTMMERQILTVVSENLAVPAN